MSDLPADASLSWSTFSSTVATVHGSGLQADLSALKPGRTTIQVALGSLTATADIRVRPVAARVVSVGGPVSQGKAGELVAAPPRVQVLDRHNSPVPGEIVRFTVATGGGGVLQDAVRTDAFGFAQTEWLLGPDLGIQVVEAAVGDLPATQLFAYVNGDFSSVAFSAKSPGMSQGAAGQPLTDFLEVQAGDAQGRPVMGVGVEWQTSHGTVLPASPVTNSLGRARARWILGAQAGPQTASVRLSLPEEAALDGGGPQDLAVQFQADAAAGAPVEVSALPERLVLELGGAAQVNVAVLDNFGNRLVHTGPGTWSFGEAGIVDASVSGSADALFTATRTGTTKAVIQVGSLADTIDVVVRPVADTGGGGTQGIVLRLSPPDLVLDPGAAAGFSLLAEDGSGNPLPANDAGWSSDDPTVATVDAFGRVVGHAEGSTTIRATLYGVTASGTVQVRSGSGGSEPDGPPARIDDLRVVESSTSWVEVAFSAAEDGTGSTAVHEIRFANAPMGWGWGQATILSSGSCASPLTPEYVGQT
ncbi:MAG: Ig-like domain-containing protein, partial [Longimicrobiales bacterium]